MRKNDLIMLGLSLVLFAILILVLLFKPSGLFGKHTREKVSVTGYELNA